MSVAAAVGDARPVAAVVPQPRIVIVSALFAPSRRIGARRPERMARGLAARGWDVTILTLEERFMAPIDPGMAEPPGIEIVRTTMTRPGSWARAAVAAAGRLPGVRGRDAAGRDANRPASLAPWTGRSTRPARLEALKARVHSWIDWLELPDASSGWSRFAVRAMRDRRPDVVLATIPPFTPAVIAGRLAERTGARVVLDYRDPWSDAPTRRVIPGSAQARFMTALRQIEDEHLQASSLVLSTTRQLAEVLQPRTASRVLHVPNSFDDGPEVRTSRGETARDLVYLGSLSYGRSLDPVIRALAGLDPEARAATGRLIYGGPHGAMVRAAAEASGVGDRVHDVGDLPRAEALRYLREAAIAVVVVADGYEYMLPAKLLEAIEAGCPVLLIGAPDCEAAHTVRRHNLGWCHAREDVEGIRESLRQHARGEVPVPRDVEELSTRTVLDRLDAELRALVPRP